MSAVEKPEKKGLRRHVVNPLLPDSIMVELRGIEPLTS